MRKYLLKRLFSSFVALFFFLTFMFFVAQIIVPTDFTTQFALSLNRERREKLAAELGIDQPLWTRYIAWFGRLLHGNLGTSFYGYPVLDQLKSLIPYTLLVFLTGTMIAFLLGKWLGKVTAWRGSGLFSGTLTFSAISLYTSFPPWLSFLITYFFARRLRFFRSPRTQDPFTPVGNAIWRETVWTPEQVMLNMVGAALALWIVLALLNYALWRWQRRSIPTLGILILLAAGSAGAWYAFGFGPEAFDVMGVAGLPILTYVLLSFGETMLIMQTSMMGTLKEAYIATARAKGLPEREVRNKHAARNALLPVFSRLVISLPSLLTGLVIVEDVLKWPGISGALFTSLYQQDIPMVMGALLLVGVLSVIARLVLDVLYVYLDPRIRYNGGELRRIG